VRRPTGEPARAFGTEPAEITLHLIRQSENMRIVLQRVLRAGVTIEGMVRGEIDRGLLLLAGFHDDDTEETLHWMAEKIVGLRIFPDAEGKMNRSLDEIGGAVLVVSQFTLYGDMRKGRRPSFIEAARPEIAIPLYERFVEILRELAVRVETGEFGAMMQVELVNDGPVTLILER
jgi:D-tyrosyl-tRNA(Tyr) deacylase